jgi:site-specific DNA recombinase
MSADVAEMQDAGQIVRARKVAEMARARAVNNSPASWVGQQAAIYCRISKAGDEDQTGVDRQEYICQELAGRLDLMVPQDRIFVDHNRSAWQRNRKRKGWDALLEAVQRGEIQHVIAYHPDRLMRQPADLEELLRIADEHHITLHGQAGGRNLADPDDRFILRIEVAHACRSSDDTSRRIKDKMDERARAGLPPATGNRCYGYDVTGWKVIEHEAEVCEAIFASFLDGTGKRTIAALLNEQGELTSKGKPFDHYTVDSILRNPRLAGLRVHRGEIIGPGTWPAIIDLGTWKEAQERLTFRAERYKTEGRNEHHYPLRSLVTCANSGDRMIGQPANGTTYYQCRRYAKFPGAEKQGCAHRIHGPSLEAFVIDAALIQLEELDLSGRPVAEKLTAEQAAAAETDRQQLADLTEMWTSREITTSEYRAMRKAVQERIENVRQKAIIRPAAEVLRGLVGKDARKAWKKLEEAEDYERMNAVLRFLFAAVIINESTAPNGRFDYGRIQIEPNPI